MTERTDEKDQMKKVVKKLALGVDTPLMIDSTEAEVVEAALKTYPGRAIINSINLEGDGSRVKKYCPLAKNYGAAVVALTIDDLYYDKSKPQEKGMAKTAARKLEVAKKIAEICQEGIRHPRRRPDLRRPHLHPGDRRGGVQEFGGGDHGGHPAHQEGDPGGADHPGAFPTCPSAWPSPRAKF